MAKTFDDAIDAMNGLQKCNITITGDIGSGKSTVAKKLAERLKMTLTDSGLLYRQFAATRNMSVLEQNNSNDWSIDREIDSTIERLGKSSNNTIFVSRLAWYFVPDAIKIYLKVNPVLAAERLISDSRVSEKHTDLRETLDYNKNRKDAELSRYKEMYNLDDPSGYSNADIICNIGSNSIDAVVECLYNAITTRTFGYYVDPKCLLPTQGIRDFNMEKVDFYCNLLKDSIGVDADLTLYGDCVYINDGHHRVVASIKLNKDFIRTPLPQRSDVVPCIMTPYDYEDLIGFSLEKEYKLHCEYTK